MWRERESCEWLQSWFNNKLMSWAAIKSLILNIISNTQQRDMSSSSSYILYLPLVCICIYLDIIKFSYHDKICCMLISLHISCEMCLISTCLVKSDFRQQQQLMKTHEIVFTYCMELSLWHNLTYSHRFAVFFFSLWYFVTIWSLLLLIMLIWISWWSFECSSCYLWWKFSNFLGMTWFCGVVRQYIKRLSDFM